MLQDSAYSYAYAQKAHQIIKSYGTFQGQEH